jgi:hypothetical protein
MALCSRPSFPWLADLALVIPQTGIIHALAQHVLQGTSRSSCVHGSLHVVIPETHNATLTAPDWLESASIRVLQPSGYNVRWDVQAHFEAWTGRFLMSARHNPLGAVL